MTDQEMDDCEEIRVVGTHECNDYLLGKCTRGDACARNHHENLNPHQTKVGPLTDLLCLI